MNRQEAKAIIEAYCAETGQKYLFVEAATIGIIGFQQELTEKQILRINSLGHQKALKISGANTKVVSSLERTILAVNKLGDKFGLKPLDGSGS